MKHLPRFSAQRFGRVFGIAVVTGSMLLAQEATAPPPATGEVQEEPAPAPGGWRRATDPPPAPVPGPGLSSRAGAPLNEYGAPAGQPPQGPPQGRPDQDPAMQQPPPDLPPTLTLKPGTFVTVRVNDFLSSDRNQPGDAFTATLVKPVVVDGVVVAEQGQTVAGRVMAVEKGGRIKGVSKLGIELSELAVVDGSQVPLHCQLISRAAPGSMGRDAGAVATTTAAGAVIGAAADWGRGEAIGAGAGAAAGLAGVLLTRGHPSIVDPESILTFRIEAPVTISTVRAPQAFRWVEPGDYERTPALQQRRPSLARAGCGGYGCGGYGGYFGPSYYPYWGNYWGPGFGVYYGPRYFYGRGFNYGRGHFRGRHR